jgi:hypothetical protein
LLVMMMTHSEEQVDIEDYIAEKTGIKKQIQRGSMTMNRSEILHQADQCITKDRAAEHGDAENNFSAIANGWNWWMSIRKPGPLTSYDTAMMMVIFKAARLAGNPKHQDSAVDLAGYAAIAGEIGSAQVDLGRKSG